jgi:hypothetical protein
MDPRLNGSHNLVNGSHNLEVQAAQHTQIQETTPVTQHQEIELNAAQPAMATNLPQGSGKAIGAKIQEKLIGLALGLVSLNNKLLATRPGEFLSKAINSIFSHVANGARWIGDKMLGAEEDRNKLGKLVDGFNRGVGRWI